MREQLIWAAKVTKDIYECRVLRIAVASMSPPNRAMLIHTNGKWAIDIWDDTTSIWVLHDTTYDDLDEAKAVAEALVAMQPLGD